ncbi:MAG TPA: SRPBCC family protein [Candidatus Polarisedimenticolia bacterium]|nr:SRPBCC family protein [Candidatus Polarisedimenticolia bacterium]
MPLLKIEASAIVPAPAATVYGLIADYRVGHPSILPPQYFRDLVVEEGGTGAGTLIRYTMLSFGTKTVARARVTEPEPGRVLMETDQKTGTETRFIVEPLAVASTRVTFETRYPARGFRGLIEAFLVPRYLTKVYVAELALLAQRAEAAYRSGMIGD